MNHERYEIYEPGVSGDTGVDRVLLVEMERRARAYFTSVDEWSEVLESRLALGVGGVIAVFLFKTKLAAAPPSSECRYDWVVCGDLPPATFGAEENETVELALDTYCILMEEWVETVRGGGDFDEVYPVRAERTQKHARLLSKRLRVIREEVLGPLTD